MRYYIKWYKSGSQPIFNKEGLYYFYWTHSKNLSAPGDTQNVLITPSPQYGNVNDEVYVTANCLSAATLRVISGGVIPVISFLRE
jgi:hypothetical protein